MSCSVPSHSSLSTMPQAALTALTALTALVALVALLSPCSAMSMWNPYARQWLGAGRDDSHYTQQRHPSLSFGHVQSMEEKRDFARYEEKRDHPRYEEKRNHPRYEENRDFARYEEKRDHRRYEEMRDRSRYEEKRDSTGYDCCGLGYRAEWVGWDKKNMKTYCAVDLPCCDGLELSEIEMWGGFGFSLCVKGKQEPVKPKPMLNPFTRYLSYYSGLPDEAEDSRN